MNEYSASYEKNPSPMIQDAARITATFVVDSKDLDNLSVFDTLHDNLPAIFSKGLITVRIEKA